MRVDVYQNFQHDERLKKASCGWEGANKPLRGQVKWKCRAQGGRLTLGGGTPLLLKEK